MFRTLLRKELHANLLYPASRLALILIDDGDDEDDTDPNEKRVAEEAFNASPWGRVKAR